MQFNLQTLVYNLWTIQSLWSRDEIHSVCPVQPEQGRGGGEGTLITKLSGSILRLKFVSDWFNANREPGLIRPLRLDICDFLPGLSQISIH